MTCRFCEKTRALATSALRGMARSSSFPPPKLPSLRRENYIPELTISIDKAADGERVWVKTNHIVARWYRIGKVLIVDRRP